MTCAEAAKHSAHGGVVCVAFVFDAHVDYVDGFVDHVLVDTCPESINVQEDSSSKLRCLFDTIDRLQDFQGCIIQINFLRVVSASDLCWRFHT